MMGQGSEKRGYNKDNRKLFYIPQNNHHDHINRLI